MIENRREARVPVEDGPAAGGMRLIEVGRHRIALFRSETGWHALADRCPHRGAPLCSAGVLATPIEARGDELELGAHRSIVRCPWHKWDFDIVSGQCLVDRRLRVRRYDVRVEDDEIVISLDRAR